MNHLNSSFRAQMPPTNAIAPAASRAQGMKRLGLLALSGCLLAAMSSGCINHEEKAKKVITEAVTACKQANPDDPIHKVEVLGGKTDEILAIACDEPIEKFEIVDNLTASAYTGPVRWDANLDTEAGVWVLGGAEWSDLTRARRALAESDPSEEQLGYAIKHLSAAQDAAPNSAWIRLRRLEALLDLRMKTRGQKTADAATIGPQAQTQFDETLAWAEAQKDLDTRVEAQYLVAEHLRKYLARIDMILESDGSSDEWLIKSADQAKKDGEPEKAAEYLKELEQTRQKRAESQKIFSERQVKVRASLCEHLSKLSPAGLDNAALQGRVVAAKEAVDCMKRAAPDAEKLAEGHR